MKISPPLRHERPFPGLFLLLSLLFLGAAARPQAGVTILTQKDATPREALAAREAARYFYLRTGTLPEIKPGASAAGSGDEIFIGLKDRPAVNKNTEIRTATENLGPEQYVLKTLPAGDGKSRRLWIVGGDETGVLYGTYRFAEKLGVRFYLHGDVIPDVRIKPELSALDETGKPLFETRGIQPFHDFAEGPDWWTRDDYLAYIHQLAKLRLNFIGFHCYPEGGIGPEPGVWIGLPRDVAQNGRVRFSPAAAWHNTLRSGMWGYAALPTRAFTAGASQLFPADAFGPDAQHGMMPFGDTRGERNAVFNNAGALLRDAFAEARALGVKTCIGTETPLTIPRLVQERLEDLELDPEDTAVVQQVYKGIFTRIKALYPVDYYWLWTPEAWTWAGNKPGQFQDVVTDIHAALAALKELGDPFTLATCGWVLGPQQDRAALDKLLPKNVPLSCINRQVGHSAVEPGFSSIQGRPKWAIPWMENDPNLVAPQPWVGRMRVDAATALRYGCTGLIGIHWRTREVAANVAALAAASWDQSWVPAGFKVKPPPPPSTLNPRPGRRDPDQDRSLPVQDFYVDLACASFGAEAGPDAGRILAAHDGTALPEPATWLDGPGGIKPNPAPWGDVQKQYAFVDELAALRPRIHSVGDLARFDDWLNTYRAMRELARAGCLRAVLDRQAAGLKAARGAARKKAQVLPLLQTRLELARAWEALITFQIAATATPGELGTLANLEQHNRVKLQFLTAHDKELAAALGRPLPPEAAPALAYKGPDRIIVPTVRTLARPGEPLRLRVLAAVQDGAAAGELFWRPLGGGGAFQSAPLRHVARGVFEATLPAAPAGALGLEYYLQARTRERTLFWPPTAPGLCQTVLTGLTAID